MYGIVGNTEILTIAYHSSRDGVINFAKVTTTDLSTYGITVNCVCPSYFYTKLIGSVLDTNKFQDFAHNHVQMKDMELKEY